MTNYETIAQLLASMGCPVKAGYVGPNGFGMLTFSGSDSAARAHMALSNAFRVRPPREDRIRNSVDSHGHGRKRLTFSEWKVGMYGPRNDL